MAAPVLPYKLVPSLDATTDMMSLPTFGASVFGETGFATFSSKNPTQVYVLFAFEYVRAVSSTPLIVYAELVTSVPPLIVVNAGAISTIKRAMMPTTINNSSRVNPA